MSSAPRAEVPLARLPLHELDLAARAELVRTIVSGEHELWVRGDGWSMWPTIRHGDQVLLTPVRRPLRVGDVVLVEAAERLMLHRIASVTAGGVTTIGDANCVADDVHPLERIVARACARRHDGRVTALEPTLRFGILPLVRWSGAWLRRRLALAWRAVRARRRFVPSNGWST